MGKRILLVDDTETVLMAEQMMLSGEDFDVFTARNGVEALEMVAELNPDLIFLDIVMPKMNGIETCLRLKENPLTKDIPVVMVTTQGEIEKFNQAFDAGCDDYITKPIDKVELLLKIDLMTG